MFIHPGLQNTSLPNQWCLHEDYHPQSDDRMQKVFPGYQGLLPPCLAGFDWGWEYILGKDYGKHTPIFYAEINPEHGANMITFAFRYLTHPKSRLLMCSPSKEHDECQDECQDKCQDECQGGDDLLEYNLEQFSDFLKDPRIFFTRQSVEIVTNAIDDQSINVLYVNERNLDKETLQAWILGMWPKIQSGGILVVSRYLTLWFFADVFGKEVSGMYLTDHQMFLYKA